jgi:hypothetical protein
MLITPNFDESEVEFAPIENGAYKARVKEIKAKNTWDGKSGLEVTYELIGAGVAGRRVWDTIALEGDKAGFFKKFYEAMTRTKWKKGTAFDTDTFLGKEVNLGVERTLAKDGVKYYTNVRSVTAID